MMEIEITDQQLVLPVDIERLRRAVERVLQNHGPPHARVSIAVVDDATIHDLNRRYLQHDYPTDVLSFVLDQDERLLEGEVIVSAETAVKQARDYHTRPEDELLLYVIHGVLHLVGFDDTTAPLRQQMRCAEREHLEQFGVAWNPDPEDDAVE